MIFRLHGEYIGFPTGFDFFLVVTFKYVFLFYLFPHIKELRIKIVSQYFIANVLMATTPDEVVLDFVER